MSERRTRLFQRSKESLGWGHTAEGLARELTRREEEEVTEAVGLKGLETPGERGRGAGWGVNREEKNICACGVELTCDLGCFLERGETGGRAGLVLVAERDCLPPSSLPGEGGGCSLGEKKIV